jgi:hypothetical protein
VRRATSEIVQTLVWGMEWSVPKQIVHKELRGLVKEIQDLGFTVRRDNGNHQKVYSEHGMFIYSLPSTPGRGRWRQNLVSELKKRMDVQGGGSQ